MASATLNIKVTPRRMLTAGEAAVYCGMTAKKFPVVSGLRPVEMPGGRKLYDIREIDAWLDGLRDGACSTDNDIVERLNL
jgi:hypothetical protein